MDEALTLENSVLEATQDVRILRNVPASKLTTFGLGGTFSSVVELNSLAALQNTLRSFYAQNTKWQILGAGSNLILRDGISDFVAIKLGRGFSGQRIVDDVGGEMDIERYLKPSSIFAPDDALRIRKYSKGSDVSVFVGGAVSLMGLSRRLSQLGLSGLEFAAGIPASLGGAVYMNAGAHGLSMSDILSEVYYLLSTGELCCFKKNELSFGYRTSKLPKAGIVIGATLALCNQEPAEILASRTKFLQYRKLTQPLSLPSAGSAFKNPQYETSIGRLGTTLIDATPYQANSNFSAGHLLEQCGLRGFAQGGVSYSKLHSNWLVKISEQAKAEDALLLLALGKERVQERFSVDLAQEIIVW